MVLNQQANRSTQKAPVGGPVGITKNARTELPRPLKTPHDAQMILKLASKWTSKWSQLASMLPPQGILFAGGSSREYISPKMHRNGFQNMLKTLQDASKTAPQSGTSKRTESPRKLTWVALLEDGAPKAHKHTYMYT